MGSQSVPSAPSLGLWVPCVLPDPQLSLMLSCKADVTVCAFQTRDCGGTVTCSVTAQEGQSRGSNQACHQSACSQLCAGHLPGRFAKP